ncbi:MAG: RNA polymerase factor sigma-54 [Gammaproteobacteria bacterium]|nr:RNA polymerase factor sigma-54 [Gammaproteobacteria bacterium]MCY4198504.1 RNA polymerase factor sigma-54 [Gammaproteobacteria bacterium]MCY4322440.1 RNA polymerase factor sigma-54 [Gammaproteobacteria bacterium]
MRQTLTTKLRQQLAITPELKQSLHLLQISSLELRAEIQHAIETNPLLEHESELLETDAHDPGNDIAESSTEPDTSDETELADTLVRETLPQELPVDTVWEDTWIDAAPRPASSAAQDVEFPPQATARSLTDDLLWQLQTSRIAEEDRGIAAAIIYSINEDGWLIEPLSEILPSIAGSPVEAARAEAVLKIVQSFEPSGVGARSLGECLSLQLAEVPEGAAGRILALDLVENHLALLAGPDISVISAATGASEHEAKRALGLILSMSPRPGQSLAYAEDTYQTPDVVVRKFEGSWRVELNREAWPSLGINPHYQRMIERGSKTDDNVYLKDKLIEARWFLRGLRGRSDTLLRVASEIVASQRRFLEQGPSALVPMVLQDVADALGMHESTISRVTANKYMQTPHGLFELKYFFPPAFVATDGSQVSSVAIRARIQTLVREENPMRPLSDAAIMKMLAAEGISVARRTIAKYREALKIPSSSARKVR